MTNRGRFAFGTLIRYFFRFAWFGYFATLRFAQYDEVGRGFVITLANPRFAQITQFTKITQFTQIQKNQKPYFKKPIDLSFSKLDSSSFLISFVKSLSQKMGFGLVATL